MTWFGRGSCWMTPDGISARMEYALATVLPWPLNVCVRMMPFIGASPRECAINLRASASVSRCASPNHLKPFTMRSRQARRFINKWLWQDPLDAIIGFSATRGQPFPNWQQSSIPALDEAFRDWLKAGPADELKAAASKVQRIAAEQLPYIPLLTPDDIWVHSNKLHGWRPFAANLYPFYQDAWLES